MVILGLYCWRLDKNQKAETSPGSPFCPAGPGIPSRPGCPFSPGEPGEPGRPTSPKNRVEYTGAKRYPTHFPNRLKLMEWQVHRNEN